MSNKTVNIVRNHYIGGVFSRLCIEVRRILLEERGIIMKVFRNLYLTAEGTKLDDYVSFLLKSLDGTWSHDETREEEIWHGELPHGKIINHNEEEKHPAAFMVLSKIEDNKYHIANIVPTESRELSYEEYNAILLELYDRFIKTTATEWQVEAEVTGPDVGIDHWISGKAVELLRFFSRTSNKSTGSSHPSDRAKWYDFIIQVHKDNSSLDAGTLSRWLHEEEEWPEDISVDLAIEYEFAIGLLKKLEE